MINYLYLFFITGLVLIIMEMFTPTTFVFFSIGVASILTAVISMLANNFTTLLFINAVLSICIFLLLRKYNPFKPPVEYKTNVNRYEGKEVEIVSKEEHNKYRVKVFGEEWTAISEADFEIGDYAVIAKVEGSHFYIIRTLEGEKIK